MCADRQLVGCRVLVVEDEAMIAMLLNWFLVDLGCFVVGPVGSLPAALLLAQQEEIDVAVLDMKIHGGDSIPVAETLQARGIPFVFASGNSDWALPVGLRNPSHLNKPFTMPDLEKCLVGMYCNPAQNNTAQRREDPGPV